MSSVYAFLFCLSLGLAARPLYLAATALAKRTDLFPVTILLDISVAAAVGGALIAYIIGTGTELAPYQFAALGAGYYLAYEASKAIANKKGPKNSEP